MEMQQIIINGIVILQQVFIQEAAPLNQPMQKHHIYFGGWQMITVSI